MSARKGSQNRSERAAGTGGGAALGKNGNSSSAITKIHSKRRARFYLREKMRRYVDMTQVPRYVTEETVDPVTGEMYELEFVAGTVAKGDKFLACGRRLSNNAAGVDFRFHEGKTAGYAGVQRCGSVWVCAVCAAKIQAQRAAELGRVAGCIREAANTLAMITVTVRHDRRDSLEKVWDAVSIGWAAVTSGSKWQSESVEKHAERLEKWETARQLALEGKGRMPRGGHANLPPQRRIGDQERYGVLGWVRSAETTVGANGWHVHLHVLVALNGNGDGPVLDAHKLGNSMFDRWRDAVKGAGMREPIRDSGGLNVTVAQGAEKTLAEYLAKIGIDVDDTVRASELAEVRAGVRKQSSDLAREITLSSKKDGRGLNRTPFELLSDLDTKRARPGDESLWREWVEFSRGRRQLTWSAGMRELAQLGPEIEDEDIVNSDEGGTSVVHVPAAAWNESKLSERVCDALEALEIDNVSGLCDWLTAQGIEHTRLSDDIEPEPDEPAPEK